MEPSLGIFSIKNWRGVAVFFKSVFIEWPIFGYFSPNMDPRRRKCRENYERPCLGRLPGHFPGGKFSYHDKKKRPTFGPVEGPSARSADPCFPTNSFLPKVETFFIPGKMFVVQTFYLLCLMLATVFNCATWRAPWIWIVCFTQSFEIEIVVRRTA